MENLPDGETNDGGAMLAFGQGKGQATMVELEQGKCDPKGADTLRLQR